ncbi:MAG: sporulation initiation factor Spo0A C-terminal domain-containing protein [Lachnospiraceae bacterium]|nr:sporulation initiation factor Spo0A C-terminal domain-containing protein [Lachnospiraceae bacterium]
MVEALKNSKTIQLRISAGFDEETGEEKFIIVMAECLEEDFGPQEARERMRPYYRKERPALSRERIVADETTAVLDRLGVPVHISGYAYLRDAIVMSVLDRENLGSVTKILYPNIAVKYHVTASRVERGIRNAIGKAFENRDQAAYRQFFRSSEDRQRPTNSEFIAVVADKLRMKYESYEAS